MHPKKVLLVPGLVSFIDSKLATILSHHLTQISEFCPYDFALHAFKGGYVGELIQWSDLISVSMYRICDTISITSDYADSSPARA